jgi:hypothetical protein
MGRDRPVVAELTGDELGPWEDIRQLGRKAGAWYRANFILGGVPVTVMNEATGWKIIFNGKGADKVGGQKGEDLYRSVVALPQILERGLLIGSEPDNRGPVDFKALHKFAAAVLIDGRQLSLIATIRETADGKFHNDLSREREEGRSGTALRHGEAKLHSSALEGTFPERNVEFEALESNIGFPASGLRGLSDVVGQILRAHGPLDAPCRQRWCATCFRHPACLCWVPIAAARSRLTRAQPIPAMWCVTRSSIPYAMRTRGARPRGLFTGPEWRALVRAARADEGIRRAVERAYVIWTPSGRPRKWWPSSMRTGRPTAPSIRPGRSCAHWSASTPFSARWGRPCGARASLTRQW